MHSHALCRCTYICVYIVYPICVYMYTYMLDPMPCFKEQILAMCWALLELRTLFNASLNFVHRYSTDNFTNKYSSATSVREHPRVPPKSALISYKGASIDLCE